MSERVVGRTARARPGGELLAAVAFLTRVPVATGAVAVGRTGAAAFGIIGAGLGAIAAIPVVLVGGAHPLLAAILALTTLTVLDGALHLDGLADTIDALAAPADRAEAARTDPRLGAAGAVSIVLVLGIDTVSIAEIAGRWPTAGAAALIVAVTVSRGAAPAWAVAANRSPGMAGGRLGVWFASSTNAVAATVAIITAAAVVMLATEFAGPLVAVGALAGVAIAVVLGVLVIRARHGLDGDGYGALIELTLAAILAATALLG